MGKNMCRAKPRGLDVLDYGILGIITSTEYFYQLFDTMLI